MPQSGEILLSGTVSGFDAVTNVLSVEVVAFALPNGRSAKLAAAKTKQVPLQAATVFISQTGAPLTASDFAPGTPVYVIGADNNEPFSARLVRRVESGDLLPAEPARKPQNSLRPSNRSDLSSVVPTKPTILDQTYAATFVVRRFPLRDYTLQVSYVRSGHSASQAVKRYENAVYAFGGGYFEPRSKRTIDFVVINGKRQDDYR